MEKDPRRKVGTVLLFILLVIQAFVFAVQGEKTDEPVTSSLTSSQKSDLHDTTLSELSDLVSSQENIEGLESDGSANADNDGTDIDDSSSSEKTIFDPIVTRTSYQNMRNRILDILMKLRLVVSIVQQEQKNNQGDYIDPDKNLTDDGPHTNSSKIPDTDNTHPNISNRPRRNGTLTSYEYPRLSLGTQWLQDWLNKPGYGLEWLYQFQNIYTVTLTPEMLNVQHAAIADGHADWVRDTTFIYMDCFFDAYNFTDEHPPTWDYFFGENSPGKAIDIAIYKNAQLGCDWWLRDINGQKIWLWSEGKSWAWDSTPGCPLGLWDGNYTYEGHTYCLGDTRGLTMSQWICGPFKEHVIKHSEFAQAFDGIQSEDYLTAWLYTFRDQIPDPLRDGSGMDYNQLTDYCRDNWNYITVNFWGDLARNGFITRLNGNGLRWRGEGYQNEWPTWQESFSGCKFEDCFKWGGWPRFDHQMYWNCYNWVEQLYHPLPNTLENDQKQGWDVTTIQVNAENDWAQSGREKFKRYGLAFTLMGDGYADCYANMNDYFFCFFLRGDSPEDAPEGIPEMQFKLGNALDDCRRFAYDPQHPLYYRQFHNAGTGLTYTVALNIWNLNIQTPGGTIPYRDGVWFEGDWPYGDYQQIIFE